MPDCGFRRNLGTGKSLSFVRDIFEWLRHLGVSASVTEWNVVGQRAKFFDIEGDRRCFYKGELVVENDMSAQADALPSRSTNVPSTCVRQKLFAVADFFERTFLLPFFGAVTTVFGIVAGYLGSHYDHEIANTFLQLAYISDRTLAVGATNFWSATFVFAVCFAGTFWAQARSSQRVMDGMRKVTDEIDRKSASLVERSQEINERVRRLHTLPPVGFLEKYREIVVRSESAFAIASTRKLELADIALAIRTQLKWVLNTVQKYDADGDSAKYGANLMLFRESAKLDQAEIERLEGRLMFVERAVSLTKLHGVLDLVVELSVSSESTFEADSNLEAFALPIPKLTRAEQDDTNDRFQYGVLPGAPDAFVSRRETVIETPEMWNEQAQSEHFSLFVRRQMSGLLSEKKSWIQSFFCIPLFVPDQEESSSPFAVLNVHRDLPNNLAAEKLELLSPLLVPFKLAIGRLAWSYLKECNNHCAASNGVENRENH